MKSSFFIVKKHNKYYLYINDFDLDDDGTYRYYKLEKDNKVYQIIDYPEIVDDDLGIVVKSQNINVYIGMLVEESEDKEYLMKKYKGEWRTIK